MLKLKKFNLNWGTVKRWKSSESLEDYSSRPHKINTTLTLEQEDLMQLLRENNLRKRFTGHLIYPLRIRYPSFIL